MMNPEVKAAWLAALRGGEFPQGRGELKDSQGQYCCLGVLCEVAVERDVTGYWEIPSDGYRIFGDREGYESDYDSYEYDGSWSSLPKDVSVWAGLKDHDPEVKVPADHPQYERGIRYNTFISDGKARLSELNDAGWNFGEIADLIEEQL